MEQMRRKEAEKKSVKDKAREEEQELEARDSWRR